MTFRSRVSVILVIFIFLLLAVGGYTVYETGDMMDLVPIVLCVALLLFVFFGIRYTIDGDNLYVGFLFYRGKGYDLKKLKSIKATYNPISSPAASLKRLKLDFGCGPALIISPASQDVFIEEILKINPQVEVN